MSQTDANPTAGTTLTAFYDRREDATKAASDLKALGLPESSIRLHAGASEGQASTDEHRHGFLHALGEFFFPNDDRDAYAEGLSRGGHVVTVTNVPAALQSRAIDILDDAGSVDVDERTEQWRAEGWTGNQASTDRLGASDHVGQPRAYAESALGALSTDPLPTRRDAAIGRGRARAYVSSGE